MRLTHQDGPLPFAGTGCRVIGLVPKGRIRNGLSPVADRLCAGRRFSRQPAAGRFPVASRPVFQDRGIVPVGRGRIDEHFASVIVRLQHLAHVQQQRADPLQLLDDLQIAADSLAVLSQPLGRPGQRHAVFFDQMIDQFQILDILRREQPVPLLVLVGLQDIELLLPEADQRRIDVEHLRHLAHRIIYLATFTLARRHSE